MKNVVILMFIILTFSDCKKENSISKYDDSIIESQNNANKFRKINLTINLRKSDGSYILLQRIDSINLKVDNKQWGIFSSENVDTTGMSSNITGNIRLTSKKINYLVIAQYQLDGSKIESAGEYVSYLNGRLVLTPGDYVCSISYLKFKNEIGETVIIKPVIFKDFKVVQNTTSSFVGEMEIDID